MTSLLRVVQNYSAELSIKCSNRYICGGTMEMGEGDGRSMANEVTRSMID